jgi:hypothetical protein
MMTVRENLIEALEGRTPETTPYSVYDWNMGAVTSSELKTRTQEPEWKRLLDMGLGISHHCEILTAIEDGVETSIDERRDGNTVYSAQTKKTPVGEIRKVTRDGWHHEDWIKTEEDYKICTWIAEHTRFEAHPERYAAAEAAVGEHGVVVMTGVGNWTHRSPAMQINIDLAGTEKFCMDVAMEEPALLDLYQARRALFLKEQALLAEMPGRYVNWLENLTINMLGPARYRDLLVSVYNEAAPILTDADKRIFVHYDGDLSCIADDIAIAPFHGIDSLTEPPEGDMTYDTCRAAWPDKVIWGNINVALYAEPADVLRQAVIEKRDRAGKQGLAFEISEDRPADWQNTIPIVLETLRSMP